MVDVPVTSEHFVRLTTEANGVWEQAKNSDDWSLFPKLDGAIEASLRDVPARDASKTPPDLLLGDFELAPARGSGTIFNNVKVVVHSGC